MKSFVPRHAIFHSSGNSELTEVKSVMVDDDKNLKHSIVDVIVIHKQHYDDKLLLQCAHNSTDRHFYVASGMFEAVSVLFVWYPFGMLNTCTFSSTRYISLDHSYHHVRRRLCKIITAIFCVDKMNVLSTYLPRCGHILLTLYACLVQQEEESHNAELAQKEGRLKKAFSPFFKKIQ